MTELTMQFNAYEKLSEVYLNTYGIIPTSMEQVGMQTPNSKFFSYANFTQNEKSTVYNIATQNKYQNAFLDYLDQSEQNYASASPIIPVIARVILFAAPYVMAAKPSTTGNGNGNTQTTPSSSSVDPTPASSSSQTTIPNSSSSQTSENPNSNGQNKQTICHNGHSITVADPAIYNAHLQHGDNASSCSDDQDKASEYELILQAKTLRAFQNDCPMGATIQSQFNRTGAVRVELAGNCSNYIPGGL